MRILRGKSNSDLEGNSLFNSEKIEEEMHQNAINEINEELQYVRSWGYRFFSPTFDSIQMRYREELFTLIASHGWTLKHWAVSHVDNHAYGYPVFELPTTEQIVPRMSGISHVSRF